MSTCNVICPLYKEDLDQSKLYAIRHNRSVLNKYTFTFITPSYISHHTLKTVFDFEFDQIQLADSYFDSIQGYNKLLTSLDFWHKINSDYILICQDDCWLFNDDLQYWLDLGYDFIGSPIFKGYTNNIKNPQIIGVGNGGLSLRNVESAINCLKIFSWDSLIYKSLAKFNLYDLYHGVKYRYGNKLVNEDLFWSHYIPYLFEDYKVAPIEKAISFGFENYPEVLFKMNDQKLPFGCHGWNRYSPSFWSQYIPELFEQ